MNKYQIRGGNPLHGTIEISGAKNAAVAILPAALLVDGMCRIENVPQISDVTLILQILRELGAEVRLVNATTVEVDCSHIRNRQVPYELGRKIRASYYLLGALLFGSVPGLLADWTGSYTAFYGLLTVLAVFAMVVVQRSYHKKSTSI